MDNYNEKIDIGTILSDGQLYQLDSDGVIISICSKAGEENYLHMVEENSRFKVLHYMEHSFSNSTRVFLKVARV